MGGSDSGPFRRWSNCPPAFPSRGFLAYIERVDAERHEWIRFLFGVDWNREGTMTTIVEYTDRKPPRNQYPSRIISPSRPGPCCFSDMEVVGSTRQEGRWVFQYRRCRMCGFTVRFILREVPDPALADAVRKLLGTLFLRNALDS